MVQQTWRLKREEAAVGAGGGNCGMEVAVGLQSSDPKVSLMYSGQKQRSLSLGQSALGREKTTVMLSFVTFPPPGKNGG